MNYTTYYADIRHTTEPRREHSGEEDYTVNADAEKNEERLNETLME